MMWKVTPHLAAQAYAFRSTLNGLIRGVTITSPDQVQGDVVGPGGTASELVGLLQYQSFGNVRSSGGGASLRFQSRRIHGYANVAYAHSRFTDERILAGRLPGSPGWLGSAGLSWASRDWTTSLCARYVGRERLDPSRIETGTAGNFVETNLRALYRTRLLYPVTLHLDVLNLFDSKGTVAASPVYAIPTLPIEGRRVLGGIEVRF
jgi:TonB dependent receptor